MQNEGTSEARDYALYCWDYITRRDWKRLNASGFSIRGPCRGTSGKAELQCRGAARPANSVLQKPSSLLGHTAGLHGQTPLPLDVAR